jgi:hypothetical protein
VALKGGGEEGKNAACLDPSASSYTAYFGLFRNSNVTLRDSVTRFFASGFFHESPSHKPLIITLGSSFRIFSKIRGDIRKSRCTTGVNDTGGKFAAGINDTGANFATSSPCVVDTCGKFATGVNDTGGKNLVTLSL